ncbi:hypothetical protein niasHT_030763 [Heterodera trifolii]|uniref:Helicase ATP-binding domain-containing protein n=1 Tax=Heterodera trifolii TaxID=157864 RepID=A0ABD2HQL1_9BILA
MNENQQKREEQQQKLGGAVAPLCSSARPPFGFPFPPYGIQLRLMRTMYDAIEQRRVAILESPTGTGKSLSAICASLSWLEDDERRGREEGEQKTEALAERIRSGPTNQNWQPKKLALNF